MFAMNKTNPALNRLAGLFVFFLVFSTSSHAQLRINEILTSTDQEDSMETPQEWIELYNATGSPINLMGYSLSDDSLRPRKWLLPSITLPANNYLLIWATGYNRYTPGDYHTNFRLKREGERLALYDVSVAIVDELLYPPQRKDVSYGRDPADPEQWLFYENPTPGAANGTQGVAGFTSKPVLSVNAGLYDEAVRVTITAMPEESVYYTLDGSEPSQSSTRYSAPLRIAESASLRARTYRTGYLPGDEADASYVIRESIDRPIITITTDPDNLWDSRTGIYTHATSTGRAWERPAFVQFFNPAGDVFAEANCGIRIHGGASRQRADKKSFRLYFRSEYGPGKLDAPVIPDAAAKMLPFDKLVLRANYNDSWVHWDQQERDLATYVYDQLSRNLSGDMGMAYSRGTYTDLYLDGQYWGVYNLCERIESDLLKTFYGGDAWDVVKDDEIKEGDSTEWNRLQSFVSRSNLRNEEDYQAIQAMVDVPEFTDYFILNIWVQNDDWPMKNYYAVRERTPNAKWMCVIWDIEYSFGAGGPRGAISNNTFNHARSSSGVLSQLFSKLLTNDDYKRYFTTRLEELLSSTLSEKHIHERFQEILAEVRPFIPREAERWNQNQSISTWEAAADHGGQFIDNRSKYVRQHVYGALGMPTPTPTPIPVSVEDWRQYDESWTWR